MEISEAEKERLITRILKHSKSSGLGIHLLQQTHLQLKSQRTELPEGAGRIQRGKRNPFPRGKLSLQLC